MKKILGLLLVLLSLQACKTNYYTRKTYDFKKPVDTRDKKIVLQKKASFRIDGITVDNNFDGARMNGFSKVNDTLYKIEISPENYPINPSPWYAFKISSDVNKKIYLQLTYKHAKHRYNPKISRDRKNWQPIEALYYGVDSVSISFPVYVDIHPQWIAAQKIINSTDVKQWMDSLLQNKFFQEQKIVGQSVLGRDIPYFRIGEGSSENKKVIILLSRQHPPEVTGFMALQYFVSELLKDDAMTRNFYKKYDIWVFPLLNPDGVDLGHWRHNAHGIDLNRDWAFYRQPEIDAVTDFIIRKAKQGNNQVILGIDFHSTFKDIYYVYKDDIQTKLPEFQQFWTTSIDRMVYPFKTKYIASDILQPVSKNWFKIQFDASGITYEVGDNTPERIIAKKSKAAAVALMDLLMGF